MDPTRKIYPAKHHISSMNFPSPARRREEPKTQLNNSPARVLRAPVAAGGKKVIQTKPETTLPIFVTGVTHQDRLQLLWITSSPEWPRVF